VNGPRARDYGHPSVIATVLFAAHERRYSFKRACAMTHGRRMVYALIG
jgi:hypothetical protein